MNVTVFVLVVYVKYSRTLVLKVGCGDPQGSAAGCLMGL